MPGTQTLGLWTHQAGQALFTPVGVHLDIDPAICHNSMAELPARLMAGRLVLAQLIVVRIHGGQPD